MVEPEMSWEAFESLPQRAPKEESKEPQKEQSYSWGQLETPDSFNTRVPDEQQEGWLSWLARNTVSNVARAGEASVGKYGDIVQGGRQLGEKYSKELGVDLFHEAVRDFLGLEKYDEALKTPPSGIRLPTSQDVRENVTEKLTGDYTNPRTKGEAAVQEYASDVGSMIGPGRGPRVRPINTLAIPTAANIVKQVAETAGMPEDKAQMAKMAVWLPLSMMANINGRQYATNQVAQARQAMPNYLQADIQRYQNRFATIERQLLHNDPRSSLARQQLDGIQQDIRYGQFSVQDLMNRYDAINAAKQDRGLFELGASQRAAAIRNIDMVRHGVRDEILATASHYPQATQQWQNGIRSLAVINTSQRYANWVDRTIKGPYGRVVSPLVAGVFGVGGYSHPFYTAGTSLAAGAGYKAAQVGYRMWTDPQLARYYWGAMGAVAHENAGAFAKNIEKLQKAYEKKYPGELFPATKNDKDKGNKGKK